MVSKLRFKNSKGHRHHSSKHHNEKKRKLNGTVADLRRETVKFHINNKIQTADQINPEIFKKCNWTTATSITDLKEGTPLIIGAARNRKDVDDTIGVISVTDDEVSIKMAGQSELKMIAKKDAINFLQNMDLDSSIYMVEPENVTQVFTVVRVDTLLSNRNAVEIPDSEKTYTHIALKNPKTKKYLSCSPDKHTLCLSPVLTAQEIFRFTLKQTATSNFEISTEVKAEDNERTHKINKLIVTDDLKIRVIDDPDDLLDDLNQFNVRVQIANSNYAKTLIDEVFKQQADPGKGHQEEAIDENISLALKDIQKIGLKLTDHIYHQIKEADRDGRLNEFLLDLKEMHLTDRRA